jgi:hypothetical protein
MQWKFEKLNQAEIWKRRTQMVNRRKSGESSGKKERKDGKGLRGKKKAKNRKRKDKLSEKREQE